MRCWLRIGVLVALCLASGATAQEPVVEDVPEAEPASVEASAPPAEPAAEAPDGDAEAKAQEYMNSANDLQDKLAQLKSLLDAKGEGADPELKARLAGLEQQLGSLGLGSLTGGPTAGVSSPELTEFLSACVAMTVRRAGLQRPSTLNALASAADGKMTPAAAQQNDIWRQVATCISQFTEDEFEQFKAGQLSALPKSYVELAKKEDGEKALDDLDEGVWKELSTIAAGLVKELGAGKEKPPVFYGLIACIPAGLAVVFLTKKFLDMQSSHKEREQRRKDKADSGSRKKTR